MLPKLGAEVPFDFAEVDRSHSCTRSSVDPGLVANDVSAERLGESTNGLTQVALEEFNNGGREIEGFSLIDDVLL